MDTHQAQQHIRGGLVDLLRPVGAPQGIDFLHQKAADAEGEQCKQHQQHHQRANRRMAQAMLRLTVDQRPCVGTELFWRRPKVRPARTARPDKPPHCPDQQPGHGVIAQPDMPVVARFIKEVIGDKDPGDGHVKQPHHRVPQAQGLPWHQPLISVFTALPVTGSW